MIKSHFSIIYFLHLVIALSEWAFSEYSSYAIDDQGNFFDTEANDPARLAQLIKDMKKLNDQQLEIISNLIKNLIKKKRLTATDKEYRKCFCFYLI